MRARCSGTTLPNCADCLRFATPYQIFGIKQPPWFTFPPIDLITGECPEREALRQFTTAHAEAQP
jgi:hypothetical protein